MKDMFRLQQLKVRMLSKGSPLILLFYKTNKKRMPHPYFKNPEFIDVSWFIECLATLKGGCIPRRKRGSNYMSQFNSLVVPKRRVPTRNSPPRSATELCVHIIFYYFDTRARMCIARYL